MAVKIQLNGKNAVSPVKERVATVALGKLGCHHPTSLGPGPPYPADTFLPG